MTFIILLFIGIILLFLSLVGLLTPWNTLSSRIGTIIIVISLIGAFTTATTQVVDTPETWEITLQNPETSGWGNLNGTWNKEQKTLSIPITVLSTGNYENTKAKIPFDVSPIAREDSVLNEKRTIKFTLEDYNIRINNYNFLYKKSNVYWANITTPDNRKSSDSYSITHTMNVQDSGTFYVEFLLNQGSGGLTSIGDSIEIPLTISSYDNYEEQYTIKFICVSD